MFEQILQGRGKGRIVKSLDELADFKAPEPDDPTAYDIETFGTAKLPGDSPFCPEHGIAGLAVANVAGDARYILVDDSGGKRPGIPVKALAEHANKHWLLSGRKAVFHNAKFDLGFLLRRGFAFDKCDLFDTWILHSVLCKGVYVSNKLKDIVQAKFNIPVESEEILKKWLEDHETNDYGEIPVDLIGPYACDDVRYALALFLDLLCVSGDKILELHRKYVNLTLALLAAEARGLRVDVEAIRAVMKLGEERRKFHREQLGANLPAVGVDFDDEQGMLGYLHTQSMHPGRSDMYGERKFHFDREALNRIRHPVAIHYRNYHLWTTFRNEFTGEDWKGLRSRIEVVGGKPAIHPYFLLSVFSKGGTVLCRKPDLNAVLTLTDAIRGFFKPAKGKRFIQLHGHDIPLALLARYMKDAGLQTCLKTMTGKQICERYGQKDLSPESASILLHHIFHGYGDKKLLDKFQAANLKVNRSSLVMERAKLYGQLPGLNDFKTRLGMALDAQQGECVDAMGAPLKISADRRYRAVAILIHSGVGNILSAALERFCAAAGTCGAVLVFARENEFLFEVDDRRPARDAVAAAFKAAMAGIGAPVPLCWTISDDGMWRCRGEDAHLWMANQLYERGQGDGDGPGADLPGSGGEGSGDPGGDGPGD
jgi:hypothetical protein